MWLKPNTMEQSKYGLEEVDLEILQTFCVFTIRNQLSVGVI